MSKEKQISWFAQACAVVGVLLWIGITLWFKLYAVTVIIAIFAVPATIYNIVKEARSPNPVCS